MNRIWFVAALTVMLCVAGLALSSDGAGGEEHPARRQVIAHAKRIDVHELDAKLAPEPLGRYLIHLLPSTSRVVWASSDCENKPSSFPRRPDTPLCASVRGNILGGSLHLEIAVGTHGSPVSGKPHVEKLYVLGKSSSRTFQSLSDFARAVKRGV